MLCSCSMLDVAKDHVQLAAGVVHRTKSPCYIVDREKFESVCNYILAGADDEKEGL